LLVEKVDYRLGLRGRVFNWSYTSRWEYWIEPGKLKITLFRKHYLEQNCRRLSGPAKNIIDDSLFYPVLSMGKLISADDNNTYLKVRSRLPTAGTNIIFKQPQTN